MDCLFRDLRCQLACPHASAVVFKKGMHVIAKVWDENHERWKRIAQGKAGVDDAEVIQKALDSLTPNRSWKERVVLKGDFKVQSDIKVPNYTVLDIKGKLDASAKSSRVLITNKDTVPKFMEIIGGELVNVQPRFVSPREQDYGKNITIKDCYIHDIVDSWGLGVIHCKNVLIKNIHVENTKYHGVRVNRVKNCRIKDCTVINCGQDKDFASQGIEISGYDDGTDLAQGICVDVRVINNYVEGSKETGIEILGGENIRVANNTIRSVYKSGIWVVVWNIDKYVDYAKNIIIKDNTIIDASNHPDRDYPGIWINGQDDTGASLISDILVINNYVENVHGVGGEAKGIDIRYVKGKNILVMKNTVKDIDNEGIRAYRSANFKITDNYIDVDTVPTPIAVYESTDYIIRRNVGYLTENSGTATITGDGTATTFTKDIDHGLVKDKLVAKITLDREGTVDKVYLVDKDGDGFKEALRVVVTYATAPADGEEVPIYWEAEVVS
ncbi:hypothetical protein DRP04_03570 [Archaeoglobales archaeon]|nr:MAG: hypothetical protein DRP04_03570 [Archaeoglobales archaeon]